MKLTNLDRSIAFYRDILNLPLQDLKQDQVLIKLEPVIRHGVNGEMKSNYLRDPDQNLVKIC